MKGKPRPFKRLVAISDLHCGHRAGLTPPDFQWPGSRHRFAKWGHVQAATWGLYTALVDALKPIDALVVLGDTIDGRGERSGGTELITPDRHDQCDMAAQAIDLWNCAKQSHVRGTPYHCGEAESWDDVVAEKCRKTGAMVKIGDHEWLTVKSGTHDVTFDLKHYVGNSAVPHTGKTAITRDEVWNAIWAEAGMQPRGDWILRGHVHSCEGGFRVVGKRTHWAMTLPALQSLGTKFGAQKCSKMVHWGIAHWDIYEDGRVEWEPHVVPVVSQAAKAWVV